MKIPQIKASVFSNEGESSRLAEELRGADVRVLGLPTFLLPEGDSMEKVIPIRSFVRGFLAFIGIADVQPVGAPH